MEWVTSYRGALANVFGEAERLLARWPSPFNTEAQTYLEKFHPLREESTKNYICYLLPLWLEEKLEQRPISEALSLANVFVMLHYFILDDLMDSAPQEWKRQLSQAELFQVEIVNQYRRLFPAESAFWDYYRQYTEQWAIGVSDESEENVFFDSPEHLAHKASPVKLAAVGMLLLTGRSEQIPKVTGWIDEVLITLQMADDARDWREDLQFGSANSLLAYIRRQRGMGPQEELSVREVEASIYVRGCLAGFAAIAAERHEKLKASGETTPLIEFHAFLSETLLADAARLGRRKQQLLQGGFAAWLSWKYIKK